MSVVVRMEIPSNCERCPMCGTASGGNGMYKLWCMCGDIPASSQRRPEDCPIICSLPEGHGRLVDADDCIKHLFTAWVKGEMSNSDWCDIRQCMNEETTIVPAERSEHEAD